MIFHTRGALIIQLEPLIFQAGATDNPIYIRGLSGKYRAYLYISALALFFIIGRVGSFKVIPTWLNNTVPEMFPLLETVLELTFRDGLENARHIIFNRRFVIESLSFEWFIEFWKQPKVTGGYVGTVRRLSKQYDTVFTQKLLHKIRWMRWRVIVVKKPVTAHTRVIPKILFKISQTVVFGIPRSFSSWRTVNRRLLSIASRTINRSAASFETIIPLFYSCFAYTLIPKGLLHHLNSFRTRLSELKTKFDANSLIL